MQQHLGPSLHVAMPCHLQVALFAGRRASDPAYLLLQNAFFARHAKGYVGTSSVYAATLLHHVGSMMWLHCAC